MFFLIWFVDELFSPTTHFQDECTLHKSVWTLGIFFLKKYYDTALCYNVLSDTALSDTALSDAALSDSALSDTAMSNCTVLNCNFRHCTV